MGIYDCWKRSKWLVQVILNKLAKEKRIVPKIKMIADGKKRRIGWKLTESEQNQRLHEGTNISSAGGKQAEPQPAKVPGIVVDPTQC